MFWMDYLHPLATIQNIVTKMYAWHAFKYVFQQKVNKILCIFDKIPWPGQARSRDTFFIYIEISCLNYMICH